jgi:hypothetical protein
MAFNLDRAEKIVGKPRKEYVCNYVVNEVLFGQKNNGKLAKDYLTYGKVVAHPYAGVVVVGKDGAHVGIFISSSEFIHSSLLKQEVIKATIDQLKWVFPNGYEFRHCDVNESECFGIKSSGAQTKLSLGHDIE